MTRDVAEISKKYVKAVAASIRKHGEQPEQGAVSNVPENDGDSLIATDVASSDGQDTTVVVDPNVDGQ